MSLTCPHCATRYEVDAAKFPSQGRSVRCAKCGHTWLHVPSIEDAPPGQSLGAPAIRPTSPKRAEKESGPQHNKQPKTATLSSKEANPSAEAAITSAGEPTQPAPPEGPTPAQPPNPVHNAEAVLAAETARARAGRTRRAAIAVGWVALALAIIAIGWAGVHFRRDVASTWPQSTSLYRQLGLKVKPRGIELLSVKNRVETEDGVHVLIVSGTLLNDSNHELAVPQIRVALSDGRHELYQWPIVPSVPALKPGQSAPFTAKLANPPSGARDVEVSFYGADE